MKNIHDFHNIESFRLTRTWNDSLADALADDVLGSSQGYTYAGGTLFIDKTVANTFDVVIGNSCKTFLVLEDAELFLFTEFYLTECWTWVDEMQLPIFGCPELCKLSSCSDDYAIYVDGDGDRWQVQRDELGFIDVIGQLIQLDE